MSRMQSHRGSKWIGHSLELGLTVRCGAAASGSRIVEVTKELAWQLLQNLANTLKPVPSSIVFLRCLLRWGSCCIVHAGFELKTHPASAPPSDEQRHVPPGPASLYGSFKWVDGMLWIFDLSKTVK